MNKQTLEARKGQLQADRDQNSQEISKLQQQIAQRSALDHTLNGAIQDVDYWLELEAKEEAERLAAEQAAADTCGLHGCLVCAPVLQANQQTR